MLRNIVKIISLSLTKSCKLKEFKMGHALQTTSTGPCVLCVLYGTGPSWFLFLVFFLKQYTVFMNLKKEVAEGKYICKISMSLGLP